MHSPEQAFPHALQTCAVKLTQEKNVKRQVEINLIPPHAPFFPPHLRTELLETLPLLLNSDFLSQMYSSHKVRIRKLSNKH